MSTQSNSSYGHIRPENVEMIEKLIAVSSALFSSRNLGDLLNLILSRSRELTWSDAGSIYLIDRSDGVLKLVFEVAQNASQPSLSLREFAIPLNSNSLAGYVAQTGESLNLPDVYELSDEVPYKLDLSFDQDIAYRTRSMLVLPMQDHKQQILGVLQLINRKTQPDVLITPENALEITQPYSIWEERVVRSLASQAAISIELNQLQQSFADLVENPTSLAQQTLSATPSPTEHRDAAYSALLPTHPLYVQGLHQNHQAFLVTNLPDGKSHRFPTSEGGWSLGSQATLSLPDPHLAPQMATIAHQVDAGFLLIPLDPEAQIWVNGDRTQQPYPLQDGDRIHIGTVVFNFFTCTLDPDL